MDTENLGRPTFRTAKLGCTPQTVDRNLARICDRMYSLSGRKGRVHMKEKRTHTNPFTEEEIESLRGNPNVQSISISSVKFTPEFKQHFYEQHVSGKPTREIFSNAGLNPDVLGQSRIDGFRYTLMKSRREGKTKPDEVDENISSDSGKESSPESKIRQLKHELAYVKQEVEFLKKLQMANTEAQQSWESKHRQR